MVAVTAVEPLTEYKLRLSFDDGTERVLDLADELWGPMAEPLRDPAVFRQVRVDPELRTIVWPNDFNLDPDVLHDDHQPEPHPSRLTPLGVAAAFELSAGPGRSLASLAGPGSVRQSPLELRPIRRHGAPIHPVPASAASAAAKIGPASRISLRRATRSRSSCQRAGAGFG